MTSETPNPEQTEDVEAHGAKINHGTEDVEAHGATYKRGSADDAEQGK